MPEIVHEGTLRTRRALLTAAAGGAAALAVSSIRPGGVAAAAANMQTETDNATGDATGVSNSADGVRALFGNATGEGTGVEGNSTTGFGVRGHSSDASDPENNTSNAGVVGVAGDTANISENVGLTGVYGYSDPSPVDDFVGAGVWGESADWGVIGTGGGGVLGDGSIGVLGTTSDPTGFGVFATTDDADAIGLAVAGRAVFSRSGKATVNAGKSKEVVSLPGCTSNTLVIAVLAQSRGSRYVRAAVPESGKFTIYLSGNVSKNTKVSWIAFTNPSTLTG